MVYEIYGNKITDVQGHPALIFNVRGGRNHYFYNQYISPYTGTDAWTGPYTDILDCEECGGRGPLSDGRGADTVTPTGYSCPDGDGRLWPTAACIANSEWTGAAPWWCGPTGTCPNKVAASASNCYTCSVDGQPQHVWRNYFWNNRTGPGGPNNIKMRLSKLNGEFPEKSLVENTHYFADRQGAVFDGSLTPVTNIYGKTLGKAGTGCGTRASRPATCSIGAAYWETDQSCSDLTNFIGKNPTTPIAGTLYRCSATNTWTAYYNPYTYPHPLRGGIANTAPAAPTGVRVI